MTNRSSSPKNFGYVSHIFSARKKAKRLNAERRKQTAMWKMWKKKQKEDAKCQK